jgi:SAM-dependent methyltransferase
MTVADYPLQRDAAEHERLQMQARFWAHDAAALFDSAGIASGWSVADFGSGTLDVAAQLAERVGRAGFVRTVDNDSALVQGMTPLAARVRASHVRITEGDAYATGWPDASLDAAHARFLACPAGRVDALLAEMRRLVRPGGVILLQEPDAGTWELPAGPAWQRLRDLIRFGFARRGGNFDVGRDLPAAFERAGLVEIQCRSVVRTIDARHAYAALPLAFARQLRPLWLAEAMATPDELDELLDEIAASLAGGGRTRTFTLVQAWACRPAD